MGKIYIIGAGPGNFKHLTIKAQEILAQADVVIYDGLVSFDILNLTPSKSIKIRVSKRVNQPITHQEDINNLLIQYAQQYKTVVRLKSGDPFIFGRAANEILALKEAWCEYEVIPGISSALAAPALAGIPLTDPVISRSFVVLTGHEPDELNWEAIFSIPTVVILMGTNKIKEIYFHFLKSDRPLNTPIAIIHACATPLQEIWTGTIQDLNGYPKLPSSPNVIVIGEVVKFRELLSLKNQSTLPLAQKTILVTRSISSSVELVQTLTDNGALVIEMPALEITPPSSWEQLDDSINKLSQFDWLIFASSNGVEFFFERLYHYQLDARSLHKTKIAVVGEKTKSTLKKYGVVPDFVPSEYIADSIVANFPDSPQGLQILFPRVETGGRDLLTKELTNQGAMVIEVPAYQSVCPETIDSIPHQALIHKEIDIITFGSSKTVHNFCDLIQKVGNVDLEGVLFASIGPSTSKTCLEKLGRVDMEANEYTMSGLAQTIINRYNNV